MRVVVVGAGLVGLALARCLARRGVTPVVLDRGTPGVVVPRPFVLPWHGFDALEDAGVMDGVRAAGWEIPSGPGGPPIAVVAGIGDVAALLAEGVPARGGCEVVGLLRDGDRVTGVRVRTSGGGEEDVPADLVVACDGLRSPVRDMAGIAAEYRPSDCAHLSFLSPAVIDRPFAMAYLGDGRQIGLLGWPGGSAGWWDVEPSSPEAVRAPGIAAFREAFTRLLPPAAPAVAALSSTDALVYREITEVRCPEWWVPGVVVIGDAAHFLGPEAGFGAGLGLGDALSLAEAVRRSPGDPDGACRDHVTWRRPAVRPYEEIGAEGGRPPVPEGATRAPHERWPPPPW